MYPRYIRKTDSQHGKFEFITEAILSGEFPHIHAGTYEYNNRPIQSNASRVSTK